MEDFQSKEIIIRVTIFHEPIVELIDFDQLGTSNFHQLIKLSLILFTIFLSNPIGIDMIDRWLLVGQFIFNMRFKRAQKVKG